MNILNKVLQNATTSESNSKDNFTIWTKDALEPEDVDTVYDIDWGQRWDKRVAPRGQVGYLWHCSCCTIKTTWKDLVAGSNISDVSREYLQEIGYVHGDS